MSDDFESFTRGKIAALRAEADRLELLLSEFVQSRRAAPRSPSPGLVEKLSALAEQSAEPRRREGSVFSTIMDAIRAAGPAGMSINDMVAVAEREGRPVERNTLRSQIWHEKKKGRLVPLENGRYASPDAARKPTNVSGGDLL